MRVLLSIKQKERNKNIKISYTLEREKKIFLNDLFCETNFCQAKGDWLI